MILVALLEKKPEAKKEEKVEMDNGPFKSYRRGK